MSTNDQNSPSGAIPTYNGFSKAATFRVRVQDITPAALATDVLVLSGSATRTVQVTKVTVSGISTAAAVFDIYLAKRTAVNTGGTSATQAPSKSDELDAASTATAALYTVNPTALGASLPLEGDRLYLTAGATTTGGNTRLVYDWGTRGDKPPTLRGVAQSLAINFNGQTVPAGCSMYLSIEWIEF